VVPYPSLRLDETVHQRVRLGILSVLAEVENASFTQLRDALDQPDGTLSRHLGVLEAAGMVTMEKTFRDRRPLTLVTLTPHGRASLDDEFAVIEEVARARAATAESSPSRFSPDAQWRPFVNGRVPAELVPAGEGPIGPDAALPAELAGWDDWAADETRRAAYRARGLRGGYARGWTRADGSSRLSILFLEYPGEAEADAARTDLDLTDEGTRLASGRWDQHVRVFGRSRFVVSISYTVPRGAPADLAADMVDRQNELLDSLLGGVSKAREGRPATASRPSEARR
jgi:DNA-binding MarR family transcriptional regulator